MAHANMLMKAWVNLQVFFEQWRLSSEQIVTILEINDEIYQSWVLSGAMSLNPRIVARCEECLSLHEALLSSLEEPQIHTWIHGPNTGTLCRGRSPIQTMCEEIKMNPHIIQDLTDDAKRHRR